MWEEKGEAGGRPAAEASLQMQSQAVRRLTLAMIYHARSGHPGGSLSCVDLLTHLYFRELSLGDGSSDPQRDRFVLSKGHACPALYATWMARGLVPMEDWASLRKLGSPWQGHPDVLQTPLAETSTGSLGQGFSVAVGMAAGLRQQRNNARVYALLGDGELQEGSVWEGAMFAAHRGLSNLCVLIDYNKMQSDDYNENIVSLEPLAERWSAFGWRVTELDGHDHGEIAAALAIARSTAGAPTVLIAHTLKGAGVGYMERVPSWHGSVALSDAELETGLLELGASASQLDAWRSGAAEAPQWAAPDPAESEGRR